MSFDFKILNQQPLYKRFSVDRSTSGADNLKHNFGRGFYNQQTDDSGDATNSRLKIPHPLYSRFSEISQQPLHAPIEHRQVCPIQKNLIVDTQSYDAQHHNYGCYRHRAAPYVECRRDNTMMPQTPESVKYHRHDDNRYESSARMSRRDDSDFLALPPLPTGRIHRAETINRKTRWNRLTGGYRPHPQLSCKLALLILYMEIGQKLWEGQGRQ
ncbi:unnamed protein product, partial [Didymodactylos carnosus]